MNLLRKIASFLANSFATPRGYIAIVYFACGVFSPSWGGASALASELHPAGDHFQSELNSRALESTGLSPDPKPEGKFIERILVVPEDAITSRDPWPLFMSQFHTETRSEVIERELLFRVGDRWRAELVAETERNLRNNLFVSVGNILPCKGSAADRIAAVVVTKDLWSLRLNSDFSYVGSNLDYLELELEEANLAGFNKDAKLIFTMDTGTLALSQEYSDPRVLGSRIAVEERGGVILNRKSRQVEGGIARIRLGQPLFSLDTKTGWSLSLAAQKDIFRLYSGGQQLSYTATSTGEKVPYSFDRRFLNAQAAYTFSYGKNVKRNFTFGWNGKASDYSMRLEGATASDAAVNEFRARVLPYSETYGALFTRFDLFGSRYQREMDIHAFALAEDFLLGPTLGFQADIAQPYFGGSAAFFQSSVKLGYTSFSADDLFSAQLTGAIRYQPGVTSESRWVNQSAQLQIRNVSPRFGIFRLHTAGRITRRFNDLFRSIDSLGGDRFLRGYPTNYLTGSQAWDAHAELRTLPVSVSTTHIGAGAFVDLGDAYDSPSEARVHASVGAGLRVLFPEFNRQVLRIDFGVPLEPVGQGGPTYWVAQFGQGF